jgi:hypothetical protein
MLGNSAIARMIRISAFGQRNAAGALNASVSIILNAKDG